MLSFIANFLRKYIYVRLKGLLSACIYIHDVQHLIPNQKVIFLTLLTLLLVMHNLMTRLNYIVDLQAFCTKGKFTLRRRQLLYRDGYILQRQITLLFIRGLYSLHTQTTFSTYIDLIYIYIHRLNTPPKNIYSLYTQITLSTYIDYIFYMHRIQSLHTQI